MAEVTTTEVRSEGGDGAINKENSTEGNIEITNENVIGDVPIVEKTENLSENIVKEEIPIEHQPTPDGTGDQPEEIIVPIQLEEKKIDPISPQQSDSRPCSRPDSSRMDSSRIDSARIDRNQSDIFFKKEDPNLSSSLFSVTGCQSRRVYRHRAAEPNNIFPGQNQRKSSTNINEQQELISPRDQMRDKNSYHNVTRPSSSIRNPLTGTGLSSNDEYKFRGQRKKDGNPLLGEGYPEESGAGQRVPPGGWSHKLW